MLIENKFHLSSTSISYSGLKQADTPIDDVSHRLDQMRDNTPIHVFRKSTRLQQAIRMRNKQGHFKKVYFWTADIKLHIESILRFDLDAMLTNHPERLNQVLDRKEFRTKYRLANPYDDPFQQFIVRPSSVLYNSSYTSLSKSNSVGTESSSTMSRRPIAGKVVETIEDIHGSSLNFVKTLPDGISAAIDRVNQSIEQTSPFDFSNEDNLAV